jgi:hypothetical protein
VKYWFLVVVFLIGKSFLEDSSNYISEKNCDYTDGLCEYKGGKCVESAQVCEIVNDIIDSPYPDSF